MRYYIKEHGQTSDDAELITLESNSPQAAAEEAARIEFDCDGWEWRWPVTLTIIDDKGKEYDFEVECEAEPVFTAHRKTKRFTNL